MKFAGQSNLNEQCCEFKISLGNKKQQLHLLENLYKRESQIRFDIWSDVVEVEELSEPDFIDTNISISHLNKTKGTVLVNLFFLPQQQSKVQLKWW